MDISSSPIGTTLQPPRKSIELEDPGAHDLETSENEEDVFADAQEGPGSSSGANSPIPTTRVEKVDDHESYGEVPGTAAYNSRIKDAVPDELEIIPDGERSRPTSKMSVSTHDAAATRTSIPKTVVQKVASESPSHGDVPGTAAYLTHMADAVPDLIVQVPENGEKPTSKLASRSKSNEVPIPTTVVTKVDSKPSHGEVSGTDAFDIRKADADPDEIDTKGDVSSLPTASFNRSTASMASPREESIKSPSPIAADGGFGPMNEEHCENDLNDVVYAEPSLGVDAEEDFGEDFDDFEAGAIDEDFGEFNENFQEPSIPGDNEPGLQEAGMSSSGQFSSTSPFPLLDFSEIDSLADLVAASSLYLDELFPSTKVSHSPPFFPAPEKHSIFLTDRSLSLWSQLVAPPPLQPPNWVRSRIRRLFLVSLGVPVDLDEILPASKQKKLVLPSTSLRSDSHSPSEGRRNGSRVRSKPDNASSASLDQPSNPKPGRKRRGPPPPPELDLGATKMLCATTEAALSNLLDTELQAHIQKLEELTVKASEALEYWLKRKDNVLGDKEAFEGVIENLVKHARRVRK